MRANVGIICSYQEIDKPMSVTMICPNLNCRTILQVPDKVRGKKVRCSKCGKNFLVPAPQKPEPKTVAST